MNYKAPLKDIQFVMNDVLDMDEHYTRFTKGKQAEPELTQTILQEFARFCENELVPINQSGDEEGCHFKDGDVTTPKGFKEAYQLYCESGWPSLVGPTEYGGQGMPESLGLICNEMMISANHAWSMYPGLSTGAIKTVNSHAPEHLKERFVHSLVAGNWTGTMCLTEPHCGSDLGLLTTSATPIEGDDGAYTISGTKIFISAGEHDLAENIVHIVLARLPDSPRGIKGISLFLVPKFNVNEDGSLGERNAVSCGSIEEKMGIHGNSTCVINFDGARGYLISEPNKGMRAMFTFINESRLGVAMHGQAHSEVSFQKAYAYAKERIQMRSPKIKEREKAADPIIVHPDVRRMLMTQKAFAEGGRMLNMYCGKLVDIELSPDFSDEERHHAAEILAILTPVAKGFLSETSMETTNHGVQIFGGHGFIKEWGMEQEVRDARISQLYEGTTGIQGLDLLGRKILGSKGKRLKPLMTVLDDFVKEHRFTKHGWRMQKLIWRWKLLTKWIGFRTMKDFDELNGAAVDYLMYAGYVMLGYFWSMAAITAQEKLEQGGDLDAAFYQAKIDMCEFYFQRLMPRALAHSKAISNGVKSITKLDEDAFNLGV